MNENACILLRSLINEKFNTEVTQWRVMRKMYQVK